MVDLIRELNGEHEAIIEILGKVKRFGIDSLQGQNKLLVAKNSFIKHLQKEDKIIYPVLSQEAAKDPEFKIKWDVFSKVSEAITLSAIKFFDDYLKGGMGIKFADDFEQLYLTLTQRIETENKVYARYSKAISRQ